MSIAADARPDLPGSWSRLERATEEAALSLAHWKVRSAQAEAEVVRLRNALEAVASGSVSAGADDASETQRLRAENAALRSRMKQARARVDTLLRRLAALEVDR